MGDEVCTGRSHRLICEECSEESDLEARRRQSHLALEDDGSETVLFFCPGCADEEFS